mmetsp:Transcript_4961/g.15659  ORF Transcript_4961/g.15659 Transcript_4961/m.15659 type:complete len:263 (-) Transcript_4961:1238-2026(-)
MHGILVAPPTSRMREIGRGAASALCAGVAPRCHRQATADAQERVRLGARAGSPLARVPMSDCSVMPAVSATCRMAGTRRRRRGRQSASNLRRDTVTLTPRGPCRWATTTCTLCSVESATFASSAASSSRRRALPSMDAREPTCAIKSSASQSAMTASQSLPPSRGSPAVATTSTTCSRPSPPISTIETSNVPPPKSKTITRSGWPAATPPPPAALFSAPPSLLRDCRAYTSAAASGSRSSETRGTPASRHAVIVAARSAVPK